MAKSPKHSRRNNEPFSHASSTPPISRIRFSPAAHALRREPRRERKHRRAKWAVEVVSCTLQLEMNFAMHPREIHS